MLQHKVLRQHKTVSPNIFPVRYIERFARAADEWLNPSSENEGVLQYTVAVVASATSINDQIPMACDLSMEVLKNHVFEEQEWPFFRTV